MRSGQSAPAIARLMHTAAAPASDARANTDKVLSPSPRPFTSVPAFAATASATIFSWCWSASDMASGAVSQSAVEPSMSVRRNVTTPDGSAFASGMVEPVEEGRRHAEPPDETGEYYVRPTRRRPEFPSARSRREIARTCSKRPLALLAHAPARRHDAAPNLAGLPPAVDRTGRLLFRHHDHDGGAAVPGLPRDRFVARCRPARARATRATAPPLAGRRRARRQLRQAPGAPGRRHHLAGVLGDAGRECVAAAPARVVAVRRRCRVERRVRADLSGDTLVPAVARRGGAAAG